MFFSCEVALLYLYKSTIQLCIDYLVSCLVTATWMLDKLQIWVYRTFSPLLVASLEPLAHHQNKASLSFFCGYYSQRYLSERDELVPLPYSCLRSTHFHNSWLDFSVTIPSYYIDVYANSFFPHTVRSLEFFAYWMLTFDLLSKWLYIQS